MFAPIIIIWLLLIGVGGIINIAKFPSVFKAFSPWAAINWFASGDAQFDSLSGVLLAVTGVEAMFANLGTSTIPLPRTKYEADFGHLSTPRRIQ